MPGPPGGERRARRRHPGFEKLAVAEQWQVEEVSDPVTLAANKTPATQTQPPATKPVTQPVVKPKPEVIAKASNYVQYANGNLASQPLLDAAVKDNPAVYPPEDVMAKLFTISPYGPREQRVLNRVWTTIKTGS